MIEKRLMRVKVADLIPYENNPREISDAAIDAVRESIRQCGDLDPIEVDENMVILSGHTRRLAYMDAGIEETDAVMYTGLSEEQKKKYRLLANKTGELTGWDFGKLDTELLELDFDGYDFGFDFGALEDDEAPPSFKEYSDETETKHKCPACGYEWN